VSRPLSVLYFSNELVRGGAEEHVLTLIRGLDREVFRPLLVCTPEGVEQLGRDLPGDVEVTTLRLRSPRDLSAAWHLGHLLRTRRVDILHSHLFYASVFASPVGWLCRVPVIIETPHVRENWRHGWLKGHFVVDRMVGRLVDRYVAVSESNRRYLIEEKGLPAAKVCTIHNGCDVGRFDPRHAAPAGLRASLSFGAQDHVVVVLARLEPQKGHRVLLAAFPEVLRHFPHARLVCVGEGSLRPALEDQARVLGITSTVRFVGQQRNVVDWLALADFTVLPSFWEGLPLAAIESLATARPVVATAVDGTPEAVVDGHTGLTVPPGEPVPLARAICRLLGNPVECQQLGQAGRVWVQEHFSQERQVRETQDLYLAAFERHAGLRQPAPGAVSRATPSAAAVVRPSLTPPDRR
jgi:glycosyltransferase involved in cell wall biosynthesis